MFLLRGMEWLPEWNLWTHAFRPGHARRSASWRAREQIARRPPSRDGSWRNRRRHIPFDRWTRFDGRRGGMQAKGFCLAAAAHSSGCSRANRVVRLPVFVFSLVFYGFHTSLFKLCTWRRANSAAVPHHSDLPLSHAGKTVCAHSQNRQFKICFLQSMMKIKSEILSFCIKSRAFPQFFGGRSFGLKKKKVSF